IIIPIAITIIFFTCIFIFKTQKVALRTLIRLTLILLVILLVFIICGLFIAPFTNVSHYSPEFLYSGTNLFGVVSMFSVLFICFTSITSNIAYLNNDLKNPSKSIPRVFILAILITIPIYLSITYVILINIGSNPSAYSQSSILLALVFNEILGPLGPFGFYLMGIGALIATLIAMNAALGSAVSIFQALARDNYVPKKFGEINKKSGIPVYSLSITAIIAILFTIFLDINIVAEMAGFIYFIGLASINFASIRLRYKRKELDRPFKAPFFPILPFIVGIFCIIFAFGLSIIAVFLGLLISIVAISIYLLLFADRPSIALTLAGLKFFGIFIIGILIWIINNLGQVSSTINGFDNFFTYVLMRILIIIGIFAIITVIFDIIPIRELVFFFTRRVDRSSVAINIGRASIISLDERKKKIIHQINVLIGILQIISSLFIFLILIPLLAFNIISIELITFEDIVIPQNTSEFIFLSSLIIFGICLFLSGLLFTYLKIEERSIGI
ncbi:MAG: APC family permease, partial [Promethearchaeota archaeon]